MFEKYYTLLGELTIDVFNQECKINGPWKIQKPLVEINILNLALKPY